ncbi:hypothetical protein ACX03_11315 [Vibrio parahaemolyticus]|nr:hypothetical protein ACX03_11315 [Vibrio parahaemolyticus]
MFSSPENQSGHRDSDEEQEIKSKDLEAQRLCQQVLTAGFLGFGEGCKYILQHSEFKLEGMALQSRIIQFTPPASQRAANRF